MNEIICPNCKKVFKIVAHGIREDGHFIEAGENDNLIVQKLFDVPFDILLVSLCQLLSKSILKFL